MHYYEIAPLKIVRAGTDSLTYSSETDLKIGTLVDIPVSQQNLSGVVLKKVDQPKYPVKLVNKTIENVAIPEALLKTIGWMSQYYRSPLATTLSAALPTGLQKNRREVKSASQSMTRERTNFVLNKDQCLAIDAINSQATTYLLHGVTGSGKTAVYIEAAKVAINNNRSAIIIVPEIALTTQLVAEFTNHFEHIILTHSNQTEAARHQSWRTALNTDKPIVVIGPRSAIFMPLKNLGLIVIDECHEPSLKQEKTPRYSALRVAGVLGNQHKATVILGSATPLITDYYLAKERGKHVISLPKLANHNAKKSKIKLIDMTKKANFARHRFLSNTLLDSIDQSLSSNGQSLIFHNRRGSTLVTLCKDCGWQAGCPHCFIPLTLHADRHTLMCHICSLSAKVPTDCPECHGVDIIHKGIGTKLIESELKKLYPDKKIVRFDSDNSSEQTLDQSYQKLYDNEIDIIIGTQMVAKGLDLPHLTTVGIIQADAGLALPDFSASERTFQLLAQAIGRVGRSANETSVVVQSYQPNHPSVTFGITQDYLGFYQYALAIRKRGNFPPFCHLLKLTVSYKTEATAVKHAKNLAREIKDTIKEAEVMGPTPAFRERLGDSYRWQIVVKSSRREHLLKALDLLPKTNWQYELDPINLL